MGILLALSGGFATGVLLRSLFIFGWPPIVFALLLSAFFAGARVRTPRLMYVLGAGFFLCAALGMFRATLADTPLPQPFATQVKQRVAYDGTVVADPDLRDATGRTNVRVMNENHSTNVLVVAPRNEVASVGDRVHVTGTLTVPTPFVGENGRDFRYEKYLQRNGVRFILEYGSLHIISPAPWYSIPAALSRAKHAFLAGLNATLPEPYSSLAGGIVVGGKSGLGQDLERAFTVTGLVQIIVLSGYNIMVVAEWVMAAFAYTRLSRIWRALAGGFAVLLFVGIAGASASALRAMLMACIALYARATGKSYAAGHALLFVVFLMLLWNPLYLAFDPGFDLSVAATAGLIWLAPIIERHLGFLRHGFWINVVATTFAAQISVLPLLLYFTGNLSLVSIPANILVAPVVPLTMGFAALAGTTGLLLMHIAPLVGILLALPAYAATSFILFTATHAAALPAASFTISLFPWWLVAISYAALIGWIFASNRKKRTPAAVSATGVILF